MLTAWCGINKDWAARGLIGKEIKTAQLKSLIPLGWEVGGRGD